jgi:hypothetical protein
MTYHYTVTGSDAQVIGWIFLAALYLSPTIAAFITRPPTLPVVLLVDVLLGWTFLGWLAAWFLYLRGRRDQARRPVWAGLYNPASGLSPDGLYWWDGAAWRDTRVLAPPHAPRSPDGVWWWDGLRWRPVPPVPPPY